MFMYLHPCRQIRTKCAVYCAHLYHLYHRMSAPVPLRTIEHVVFEANRFMLISRGVVATYLSSITVPYSRIEHVQQYATF